MDKLYSYHIRVETVNGDYIGTFNTINQAVLYLNLPNKYNIYSCLCGIKNTAHNYKWYWEKSLFTSLKDEKWKDIVGYEGLYKVSNFGRVISTQFHGRKDTKLMSQSTIHGYKVVKLRDWEHKKVKTARVHRLVAEAFIPNKNNKPYVDHIDTDVCNNNVNNLRWVTSLENSHNPITIDRLRKSISSYNQSEDSRHQKSLRFSKKVDVYSLDGDFIKTFNSQIEASKTLNVSNYDISKVCRGKQKSSKGYIFKYHNNKNNENT